MDGDAFGWEFVGRFISEQQNAAGWPSAGFAWHVGHELVEDAGIGNGEQGRSGIVEDVSPFRAVLMRVHGSVSGTDAVGAIGKCGPFHGVVENQGHTVAGFDADS